MNRCPLAFVGALLIGACLLDLSEVRAQVKYPPRAEKLDIQIRYRIRADRDERVRQFRALTAHLDKLGFVAASREDADLEILDPTAERFVGTIPSANVFRVLENPRVQTILFAPAGFMIPDDLAKPVPVRIGLPATELPARDQKLLHAQTLAQLERMGFQEAIGYDHRGYTLLRGSIPAENVYRLLKDLRWEPAGWFLPDMAPNQLPVPLRDVLPIRWVEVLPEAELTSLAAPPIPANFRKFTPDLQASLAEGKAPAGSVRVEAVLDRAFAEIGEDLRNRIRGSYSGGAIEGVSGHVLSLSFEKAADLNRFALEPEIMALRLPRAGLETVHAPGADAVPAADVLASLHVDRLLALGHHGQGVRLVVVAAEFPGLEAALGKELPRTTRLIDLTAELSRSLTPLPASPAKAGQGMAVARAAAAAAPAANLVLVRVDRDSFFQLGTVARFIAGDTSYSEAMRSRIAEMASRGEETERLKSGAIVEYRKAFADLSDEDAPRERRAKAQRELQKLLEEEKALTGAILRSAALQDALQTLVSGTTVVVNTLAWEAGYPVDGLSSLSQKLDHSFAGDGLLPTPTRSATRPRLPNAPLWVQAAGDSEGSVWAGPFLDEEGDGTMEFAPATAPLPATTWTRELNFLGVRAADGMVASTVPMGARVRLTVQWRELHHPAAYIPPDPVFPLTLRLLRQLDPEGEKRASDEMEEVARSAGPAVPLKSDPRYTVYEQSLFVTVPAEGRYAVRVEGRTAFDHRLPALRQAIEVQPSLYVEFLGEEPAVSRPVFQTFTTPSAGVGIPGDARSALTVAAIRAPSDARVPLLNGGPGLGLLVKPDLYAVGSIAGNERGGRGPGVAAGYVAGLAASMIEAGAGSGDLLRALRTPRGGTAIIPLEWLQWVKPISPPHLPTK